MKTALALIALSFVVYTGIGFAQVGDGGAPPDAVVDAGVANVEPAVPGIDIDHGPTQLIVSTVNKGTEMGKAKHWGPMSALLLYAVVALLRMLLKASWFPAGKFKDVMTSKWGGWGINLAISISGGIAIGLMAGGFTFADAIDTVISAVSTSLTAAGAVALKGDVKSATSA